jgi:RimJ/RimL family protein N-acetyltransferase
VLVDVTREPVWDRRTWETSAYDLAGEHAQEELGWALVQSAWGYGYAMEAAQAVKSWCHRDRGIERLVSLIAPDNIRSQCVAEKLGPRPAERIKTTVGPTDVWAYHR